MPSANVHFPLPLTRQNPWYPGQVGVPGGWTETGLRLHCTGAIFYVDPNHTDANDQRDGTDPTAPLATVATALTKCQAYRGDVIAVMANGAWSYAGASDYATAVQECVTVSVPGVRIVGVAPSGALGVVWEPSTADGVCITVNAMDTTIEGFCFVGNGGGTGILAAYSNANDYYGDNLTVRHCFFNDSLDEGIQLEYSWYVDIHHNMFDECAGYGIYTVNTYGDAAYERIHHNWFYDCVTSAIWLPGADRCHIYENTIYNNDAAINAAGTPANCMINFTNGSRNTVHRNTLSCLLPAAVAWDYNACNTAGIGDAWVQNYLRNGPSTTNPT